MELDHSFLQDTHVRCMGGGIARRIFGRFTRFSLIGFGFTHGGYLSPFFATKGGKGNVTQRNLMRGRALLVFLLRCF